MSATVYSRCIAKNSARGWWNIPDIFQFVPDSLIIILNLLDLQPQSFDVVLLGEIDVRQGVHPALKDKLDQLRDRIDVDFYFSENYIATWPLLWLCTLETSVVWHQHSIA